MSKNKSVLTEEIVKVYNEKKRNAPMIQSPIESFIARAKGEENNFGNNVELKSKVLDAMNGKIDASEVANVNVILRLIDKNIKHGIRLSADTFVRSCHASKTNGLNYLTREFRGRILTEVAGDTFIGKVNGEDTEQTVEFDRCIVASEYNFVQGAQEMKVSQLIDRLPLEDVKTLLGM